LDKEINNNMNNTAAGLNLAERAQGSLLTLEEVKVAEKRRLEEDKWQYNATSQQFSVLFCAIANRGCSIEIVQAIIDKGVNVNELSTTGSTPLMHATIVQRWDVVQLLLQRGADAQIVDKMNKRSALHYAAGHEVPNEIIVALVNAGADPDAKDRERHTPADVALHMHHYVVVGFLNEISKITKQNRVSAKSAKFMA
jgi:ankyrin repeat protein